MAMLRIRYSQRNTHASRNGTAILDSAIASRQPSNYDFGNDMETAIPDTPPTLQDWSALYAAAMEFRQLAPWQWMYDEAVFGVKDPVSGHIG